MIGYDGNEYHIGDRIELCPSTDLWMRGARYGEVVGTSVTPKDRVKVKLDKLPNQVFCGSEDTFKRLNCSCGQMSRLFDGKGNCVFCGSHQVDL